MWSSPRLRAQRTAALAGLHIDEVVDDLAEWAYGDYEGITSKQIHESNPGWSIFTDGAPGGESPEEVAARGDRVLARAKERSSTATSHWSATDTSPGCWRCAGWVCRSQHGGLILMNPAAITVLGTYHDEPCIEHANIIPFRPPHVGH